MNANRMLQTTNKSRRKTTEKLSSGYRINRAADDAAGLSISEKMRKQIRGLDRASANAQDGVSFCQVADGAMDEIIQILQRENELALQSANGINSTSDREAIQREIEQLNAEINRINDKTTFNSNRVFSEDTRELQTYTMSYEEWQERYGDRTISQNLYNPDYGYKLSFDAEGHLLIDGQKAVLKWDTTDIDFDRNFSFTNGTSLSLFRVAKDAAGNPIQEATIESLVLERTVNMWIPTASKQICDAFPSLRDAFGKDGVDTMGVYLSDDSTSNNLASVISSRSGYKTTEINMQINMGYYRDLVLNNTDGVSGAYGAIYLDRTIEHELMHAYMSSSIQGFSGLNHAIKEGLAEASHGIEDVRAGGIGWLAENPSALAAVLNKPASDPVETNDYSGGFIMFRYLGTLAERDTTTGKLPSNFDLARVQNASREAADRFMRVLTEGSGAMTQDRIDAAVEAASGGRIHSYADLVANITSDQANALSGDDFLKSYCGIILHDSTTGGLAGGTWGTSYSTAEGTVYEDPYQPIDAYDAYPLKLDAHPYFALLEQREPDKPAELYGETATSVFVGADSSQANLVGIQSFSLSCQSMGILNLSVVSEKAATMAIDTIGNAINYANQVRSYYGAVQNRLEHTIANLDNVAENTQAAESRIQDTDMAKYMVEFQKENILAQAGQAILAQANQSSQGVMTLLG